MNNNIPSIVNNFNGTIGQVINHVDNFYAAPPAHTKVQNDNAEDVPYQPVESYCPYINREKIRELGIMSPADFQTKLHQACLGNAPQLAEFLKHYHNLGYLHFNGHNKKQIFETLCTSFPDTITYQYSNFATYY